MIEQIKQIKGALIMIVSLVAFGFFAYPQVNKIARPLNDIADTLNRLEMKVDSLSRWTELRFQGNDVEIVIVKERIAGNTKLIEILAREH